jgi:hypothetical protein
LPKWMELIGVSFLSDDFKQQFKEIINERLHRLS